MLKLLGALLVMFGFSYIGYLQAKDLKNKVNTTEDFIDTLAYIKREITQSHRSLPDIIRTLSQKEFTVVGLFFKRLRDQMEENDTFAEKWLQSFLYERELDPQLQQLLEPLGDILGQYDSYSQGEALDRITEHLEELKRIQQEESIRLGRVYCVMGFSFGMFLVILLL